MSAIEQACPGDDQRRFDELVAKRQDETLTPEEHDELIKLTDRYEAHDAARIAALVEMAQERGITLADLMATLDSDPHTDA